MPRETDHRRPVGPGESSSPAPGQSLRDLRADFESRTIGKMNRIGLEEVQRDDFVVTYSTAGYLVGQMRHDQLGGRGTTLQFGLVNIIDPDILGQSQTLETTQTSANNDARTRFDELGAKILLGDPLREDKPFHLLIGYGGEDRPVIATVYDSNCSDSLGVLSLGGGDIAFYRADDERTKTLAAAHRIALGMANTGPAATRSFASDASRVLGTLSKDPALRAVDGLSIRVPGGHIMPGGLYDDSLFGAQLILHEPILHRTKGTDGATRETLVELEIPPSGEISRDVRAAVRDRGTKSADHGLAEEFAQIVNATSNRPPIELAMNDLASASDISKVRLSAAYFGAVLAGATSEQVFGKFQR
jgi:hypothetical protein